MQSRFGIRRLVLFILPLLLVIPLVSSLFNFSPANAASLSLSTEDQTRSITDYNVLRVCVANNMYGDINTKASNNTDATPTAISWFDTDTKFVVYGSPNGKTCNSIMSDALRLWGFKADGSDFLTKMGYKFQSSVPRYSGSSDGKVRLPAFESLVQSVAFDTNFRGDAALGGATKYYAYKTAVDICQAKSLGAYDGLNSTLKSWVDSKHTDGDTAYTSVQFANPDGTTTKYGYTYNNTVNGPFLYGAASNSIQWQSFVKNSGALTTSCSEAISSISSSAQAAATALAADTCKKTYSTTSEVNACANGASNRSNITYCSSKYKDLNNAIGTYDGKKDREACYAGQGNAGGEQCVTAGFTTDSIFSACTNGVKNKDPAYCDTTYAGVYSAGVYTPQDKEKTACKFGQALQVQNLNLGHADCTVNPAADGCSSPKSTTSCVIDGVGWIVCSMANFFASVSDNVYGLIQNLLKVPVINTDTSSGANGVYNAWVIMRNIANVAFVIGFLIIIFSQITSLGVSNYGVKKTLPRLVIAAILVNVSFWLSAVAVDLSNILGTGIYDLMSGVKNSMNIGISSNWGNIIGGLLAGGAVSGLVVTGTIAAGAALIAGGGGMAIVFLAIPLVLAAVLAILLAAFVLIARQALVVILIILSPLAFVALLLPNTEKLFSKWRSALVSMLVMYPMISIVFGGAQIAGLAIMSTAAQGDAISAALAIVVGQTVMVIPFFFIPALIMKFSGDNLKGVVSALSSKGKGLIGGISGAARKEGMGRVKRGLNTMKYGENAPTSRFGSAFRKYGRKFDQMQDKHGMADSFLGEARQSATRARLGETAFATGAAAGNVAGGQQIAGRAQAAAEAEELKKALQPLIRSLAGMDPGAKSGHLSGEIAAGGARSAAALHYAASIGDSGFMRQQIDAAEASGNEELKRQAFEAVNANSGALLAKAPDLVKGSKAAFANVKGADLATFTKDTAQAYMKHLSSISDPGELETALNGFNSAVEDITKSADLQSKFSGDTGDALSKHAATLSPTIQAKMFGTAAIGTDGKIR